MEEAVQKSRRSLNAKDEAEPPESPPHVTNLQELLGASASVAEFKEASPENVADLSQILYYPSSQAVVTEEKLGSSGRVRFLEEEGIYVPTLPNVRWKMRSKMERRLVTDNPANNKWFQEDGELKSCEEEMLDNPVRPNFDEENITIGTIFKDCNQDIESFIPSSDTMILLELQLNSLHFTQHPLFTNEHSLAQRLTETFYCYQKKLAARSFERMSKRLTALRHAYELLRSKKDEEMQEKIKRYELEIKDLRTTTLLEGAAERSVLSAVLAVWQEMQDLRERQGFVGCPTKLTVNQGTVSDGRRKREEKIWKETLKQIVRELRREKTEEENEESEGPDLVEKAAKLLKESLKPPGEPEMTLLLTQDLEISSDARSLKAQNRLQNHLQRQKICLKVLYNNSEVCQTMPYVLDSQTFSFEMGIMLPLSAVHWPQNFSIQILEQSAIKRTILSEVSLPLPEKGCTREMAQVEKVFFGSETHSGYVLCKTGWGSDAEGNLHQPSGRFWETSCTVSTRKVPKSSEELQVWIDRSRIDPNNPANSEIISKAKEHALDDSSADPLTSDLNFCTEAEFREGDARLKILELREQGHPGFCNMKMVPINARELPEGLLKELKERNWQQSRQSNFIEEEADDSLANHRAWALNSIREIKEKIQRQGRLSSRRKTMRELVTEDLVPDIGTLGLTLMAWFQPSRPLRPMRKPRPHVALPGTTALSTTLIINVVSALQVPTRKDLDLEPSSAGAFFESSPTNATFNTVAVRPFVEVSFKGATARTRAAEGANPTWNSELQIPIQEEVFDHDLISIRLFDEIVVDVLDDERLRDIDVHTRHEKAWLGAINIPFSAVQRTSKIDGTFPLNMQQLLLGYEQEEQSRQFGPLLGPLDSPRGSSCTFLNFFVTLQPPMVATEPETTERLECLESSALESHLENWNSQVTALFSDRKVPTLVATSNGKTVCVTRLFRPINPPELKESHGRSSAELASRFVSLIPRTSSSVCLSAEEILKLCYGDIMSNAILLTCLLQSLNMDAWLLVGWGFTRGAAYFVLTKNKESPNEMLIWDICTGQNFKLDDPFCPATLAWAVVNHENIWANIQRESAPRRMRFDLSRASDWLAAFAPASIVAVPGPEAALQPETVQFTRTPEDSCKELVARLESSLKDNFMTWRTNLRTRWNRHCCSVLRKVLPILENSGHSKKEAMRELQPLIAAHKMIGFPLHLTYADDKEVIRTLFSTQLHSLRDAEIEFGIAVAAFPYVNNAVSLWVFIAALSHRR
ncbi:coiled-coil and C2 domain-containing protein 2A [Neocloeon triangulifer]|uniref:coiled-coil and C2 domain-containing protein 2A n=1 Tax=Neocloeon triangulifer TaxID=2078957 RepID=UPI00286F09D3|nr:coiled-coil and C2 domain-containing protein 2A [Neocloeon triangulifer]